jgi:hypothetical protein
MKTKEDLRVYASNEKPICISCGRSVDGPYYKVGAGAFRCECVGCGGITYFDMIEEPTNKGNSMKTKEELRGFVIESLTNMNQVKLECRDIYVEIANRQHRISENDRELRNLAYNLWQAFEDVTRNIERCIHG